MDEDVDEMRNKFEEILKSKQLGVNSSLIRSVKAYEGLIAEVEVAKIRTKKTSMDLRRLKRYDVLTVGDTKRLIYPLSENAQEIKYYIHFDQLFDIIHATHLAIGHGGVRKMEQDIKKSYVNITQPILQIYLELCASCVKKKSQIKNAAAAVDSILEEMKQERVCIPMVKSPIEETPHEAEGNFGTGSKTIIRLRDLMNSSELSEDDDEITVTQLVKSSKRPLILIHRKRPANENVLEQVHIPTKKRETEEESIENHDEDAYIFGMGVAAQFKEIKNERLKIRVQRDIDTLLYDAITETGRYSIMDDMDIEQKYSLDAENQYNSCDEFDIKIEDTEID